METSVTHKRRRGETHRSSSPPPPTRVVGEEWWRYVPINQQWNDWHQHFLPDLLLNPSLPASHFIFIIQPPGLRTHWEGWCLRDGMMVETEEPPHVHTQNLLTEPQTEPGREPGIKTRVCVTMEHTSLAPGWLVIEYITSKVLEVKGRLLLSAFVYTNSIFIFKLIFMQPGGSWGITDRVALPQQGVRSDLRSNYTHTELK